MPTPSDIEYGTPSTFCTNGPNVATFHSSGPEDRSAHLSWTGREDDSPGNRLNPEGEGGSNNHFVRTPRGDINALGSCSEPRWDDGFVSRDPDLTLNVPDNIDMSTPAPTECFLQWSDALRISAPVASPQIPIVHSNRSVASDVQDTNLADGDVPASGLRQLREALLCDDSKGAMTLLFNLLRPFLLLGRPSPALVKKVFLQDQSLPHQALEERFRMLIALREEEFGTDHALTIEARVQFNIMSLQFLESRYNAREWEWGTQAIAKRILQLAYWHLSAVLRTSVSQVVVDRILQPISGRQLDDTAGSEETEQSPWECYEILETIVTTCARSPQLSLAFMNCIHFERLSGKYQAIEDLWYLINVEGSVVEQKVRTIHPLPGMDY